MIAPEALLPPFVFGLANAAHCAGMCGVFAVRTGGIARFAAYSLGKTATYVALGAVAGAVGAQALRAMGGAQAWLGLAAGAVMVVAGLAMLRPRRAGAPGALVSFLAPFSEAVERARATGSSFLFGAATGLLPCGVVYMAATQGAATASPAGGALSMAAFGLGTVPVLLVTLLLGNGVMMRLGPSRVRTAGAILVTVTGVVTAVRSALPLVRASGGEVVPSCCEVPAEAPPAK